MLPISVVVYVLSVGELPWYWCMSSRANGGNWLYFAHDVRMRAQVECARRCDWNGIVRA